MKSIQLLGGEPTASDHKARPFSPAVRAGDFVFISGQVPTNANGELVGGTIEVQTRQVFKNLEKALELAGCTLQDVCKTSVWLADARDFGAFNRIYMECFGTHRPARSTVEARLMVDARLEIDVTAYQPATR
ncbi:MAG: RidA family protein [Castellaniella sp.]|uniref:RidA family protein n=1 Tax=Castellaniella sp. TaxID=1955812 RepID=UPI00121AD6DF|nr:RidA family protein [Castellaniella sp.]TAN27155.1 MAG: RidA family protein [Castellaniella sp.]